MNARNVTAIHDVNARIDDALIIGPQTSHLGMLNSLMRPIQSRFEVKLTVVRINADAQVVRIKPDLPPGFQIKKHSDALVVADQSVYKTFTVKRHIGQTLSIYPDNVQLAQEAIANSPVVIIPELAIDTDERRKVRQPLRFKVYLPAGWMCAAYEHSPAQDGKSSATDILFEISKLFMDYETGVLERTEVLELLTRFVAEYGSPEIQHLPFSKINPKSFMPIHRACWSILRMFDQTIGS